MMHGPAKSVSVLVALASWGCGNGDARARFEPGEELPGGATTNTLLFGTNAFGAPASNLASEHHSTFFTGNAFFRDAWVQAPSSTMGRDGLGPLFNARSCGACHAFDGRGRPPLEPGEAFLGLLLRLSLPGVSPDGSPISEPTYGGQLQPFALSGVPVEGAPRVDYAEVPGVFDDGTTYTLLAPTYSIDALGYGPIDPSTRMSPRVAPQVFGVGLLEAIPASRLFELADPEDADGDGISGRVHLRPDPSTGALVPGRFGWKGEQPFVRTQAAGALAGDMGITSPIVASDECTVVETQCLASPSGGDPEIDEASLAHLDRYMRLLAPPARPSAREPEVLRGKALFLAAGCDGCHVPSYETSDVPDLPELSRQRIFPYTDLLLHDLGGPLSDGREVFDAAASEWRTPPLWGIGRIPEVNGHDRLLHDGRARGVAEAILWHAGEAEGARDAFRAMSGDERAALVRFVESL